MKWVKGIFYWLACLFLVIVIAGLITLHYLPGWTDISIKRSR